MAYTPVRLYQGQPGTSETTILAAITGSRIVKQMLVCNTTGSAATISVSLVPSGGTAGVTNRLLQAVSVPANTTLTFDITQVMTAGDFLSALQGTSAAITLTISGVSF